MKTGPDITTDLLLAEAFRDGRRAMLSRARSIVKNAVDAEDVVQEAFERAWRARARFTGERALPWLLAITKRVALDNVRSARRQPVLDGIPASDEVLALIERSESARFIADAVDNLARPYRDAFILHDVAGYSSHDLAYELHLPYHTVRTHLQRARCKLRATLKGLEAA